MSEVPGVVVAGGAGRMGQMLIRAVHDSPKARLCGVLVRPGHDWAGVDVGEAMGMGAIGIRALTEPLDAIATAQAVIDFTSPANTLSLAEIAAQARAVHVIGTTGFDEPALAKIALAARHAVVVRAGNMSLGVNLLTRLTAKVAAALGEEFDIEITEAHHRHKVDAPSGTALMLGEAAASGRGKVLADVSERGRDGITGARQAGAIGFSCVRGGDIVGEHEVLFAGAGERIALRHIATDRAIFARGALQAALWGQGKHPGEYSMMDVLGI